MEIRWKPLKNSETVRFVRACRCGKGEVITYDYEEVSDKPPFERIECAQWITCSDNCERIRLGPFEKNYNYL